MRSVFKFIRSPDEAFPSYRSRRQSSSSSFESFALPSPFLLQESDARSSASSKDSYYPFSIEKIFPPDASSVGSSSFSESVSLSFIDPEPIAQKLVLKVTMSDDKTKKKAIEAAAIYGVDSIEANVKEQKLTVIGQMDPVAVVKKLRKFVMVDIISVGPAKEEKKDEKEEDKKEENKEAKKEEKKEEKKVEENK